MQRFLRLKSLFFLYTILVVPITLNCCISFVPNVLGAMLGIYIKDLIVHFYIVLFFFVATLINLCKHILFLPNHKIRHHPHIITRLNFSMIFFGGLPFNVHKYLKPHRIT